MNMSIGHFLRWVIAISLFLTTGTVPIGCTYAQANAPLWLKLSPGDNPTPIAILSIFIAAILLFLTVVAIPKPSGCCQQPVAESDA